MRMVFMTAMSGNVAIQKRSISATLDRERLSLVVPGHRSSRECRPRAKPASSRRRFPA